MALVYGLHSGDGVIRYVGRTRTGTKSRMASHKYRAKAGVKYPVYDWMRSHGLDNIQIVIIEDGIPDPLIIEREQYWIDSYLKTGMLMNIALSIDGALYIPDEQRMKISSSLKEFFANNPAPNLGRKSSQETRKKISEARLGKSPWNKGVPTDPDKISRGESHSQAKLTESNVRQILDEGRWGTYVEIGKKWGVSNAQISLILRGKSWTHIARGVS